MKDGEAGMEFFGELASGELELGDFQEHTLAAFLLLLHTVDDDFGVIKANEFITLLEDAAQLGIADAITKSKREIETELGIGEGQGIDILGFKIQDHNGAGSN